MKKLRRWGERIDRWSRLWVARREQRLLPERRWDIFILVVELEKLSWIMLITGYMTHWGWAPVLVYLLSAWTIPLYYHVLAKSEAKGLDACWDKISKERGQQPLEILVWSQLQPFKSCLPVLKELRLPGTRDESVKYELNFHLVKVSWH